MKNARKFTAALLAFFLVFNVTPPMASAIEEETGPIDNGTAWESVPSDTEYGLEELTSKNFVQRGTFWEFVPYP